MLSSANEQTGVRSKAYRWTLSKVLQREPDFDALRPRSSTRQSVDSRVLRKGPKYVRRHPRCASGAGGRSRQHSRDGRSAARSARHYGGAPCRVAAAVVVSAMVGAAAWTLKPTPPGRSRVHLALPRGSSWRFVNSQPALSLTARARVRGQHQFVPAVDADPERGPHRTSGGAPSTGVFTRRQVTASFNGDGRSRRSPSAAGGGYDCRYDDAQRDEG